LNFKGCDGPPYIRQNTYKKEIDESNILTAQIYAQTCNYSLIHFKSLFKLWENLKPNYNKYYEEVGCTHTKNIPQYYYLKQVMGNILDEEY